MTEKEWRDFFEPFHVGNAVYIHKDGRRRDLISSLNRVIAKEKVELLRRLLTMATDLYDEEGYISQAPIDAVMVDDISDVLDDEKKKIT